MVLDTHRDMGKRQPRPVGAASADSSRFMRSAVAFALPSRMRLSAVRPLTIPAVIMSRVSFSIAAWATAFVRARDDERAAHHRLNQRGFQGDLPWNDGGERCPGRMRSDHLGDDPRRNEALEKRNADRPDALHLGVVIAPAGEKDFVQRVHGGDESNGRDPQLRMSVFFQRWHAQGPWATAGADDGDSFGSSCRCRRAVRTERARSITTAPRPRRQPAKIIRIWSDVRHIDRMGPTQHSTLVCSSLRPASSAGLFFIHDGIAMMFW
jgi:hypothetical protein